LFEIDTSWFQVDLWLIAIVVICIIVFLVFAVIRVIKAHQRQVSAGKEEFIGKTAIIEATLEPKGTVFFQGELWKAISETGRIELGEEVIITKVNGLTLYVNKKQ